MRVLGFFDSSIHRRKIYIVSLRKGGKMSKQSDWRNIFRHDIGRKMEQSKKEFELYKKTGYVIHLQQAGNKMFSIVENHLMLKYDKRLRSYRKLLDMVSGSSNDSSLLAQAAQLHYFYYNGDLQMSREEAEILYRDVRRKMRDRLR